MLLPLQHLSQAPAAAAPPWQVDRWLTSRTPLVSNDLVWFWTLEVLTLRKDKDLELDWNSMQNEAFCQEVGVNSRLHRQL